MLHLTFTNNELQEGKMRILKAFLVAAIMIAGVTFTTAEAQANDSSLARQTIEKKIYKEIITLPYYGLFDNIGYQLEGSTVILSGKVVEPTTKSSAGNVVRRIKGVSNVVNNIEVLPLSNFDNQIRYQVANTLASRGGSFYRYIQGASPSVKIIVKNGNVSLEGYVANRGDAVIANILTRSVFGVFNVENNLIVNSERRG